MAARILTVRQQIADLKAEGLKILDVAAKDRTPEQTARLDAIETEIVALDKDLTRLLKLQQDDVAQATPNFDRLEMGANRAEQKPATLGEVMQAMAYQTFQAEGRRDRAATILPNGIAAHVMPTLQAAATGASSGNPESGGVLVRTEWSTALLGRVQESAVLAPRCLSLPIGEGSDGIEAPFVDETSRATGSRWGGVQVYRAAEAETVTSKRPTLGKFELRLEDLMALFYGTDRVLRDASLLEALAMKAFASEFAFKLDDEIIRGTGAGQCLGIIGNAPTVSVSKETSQPAATILYENIIKMHARLLARCMSGAAWFINQTCLPQLNKMYVSIGTAGVPVYLPANGVSDAPYGTLMGLPVVPIEQASAVGTVGDIILGNFSNDYLLIQKPMTSASSIHVRFVNNETVFRWVWPVIGKPVMASAVTPYKGSDTLGPWVTLATRA